MLHTILIFWAPWTAAMLLMSWAGWLCEPPSCLQSKSSNSSANLCSSGQFENRAPALKWRETDGGVGMEEEGCSVSTHLPTWKTNANQLPSYRLTIEHLAGEGTMSDTGVCPSRRFSCQTVSTLLSSALLCSGQYNLLNPFLFWKTEIWKSTKGFHLP